MELLKTGKHDKKVIGAVSILFYGFFFFFDGVYIAADSASYINMNISREPLYPLFLALLRNIFGEGYYLNAAVGVQCLLAAFTAYWATSVLMKQFHTDRFMTGVILLIQFGVTILNRFFALRSIGYINSIQTEGIAISLYMIWAVFLIRYLCVQNKWDLLGIFGIAVLLISIRKQMLLTLPVIGLVLFCIHCVPKIKIKKLLLIVCALCTTFFITILISRAYNYAYRGSFVGYTDSSNTMFTNMLYAADEEDVKLIQDPAMQELYRQLFECLDEQQLNYKYAPEGVLNLEAHYSESYDLIAITTVQPFIKQYVRDSGIEDETQVSMIADQIRTEIMKDVLVDNLPQMGRVYLSSVVHGFILTIAKQSPILNLYAFGCYIAYIIMLILLIKKEGMSKNVRLSLLTGLLVVCNVMLTAAFIFSQTRYMIYNMALCYITAVIMVRDVYKVLPVKLVQFIKFGLVGASNTLISYGIYYAALLIGLHYQLGNLIAYIITVFISYLINGYWVFKKDDDENRGFWKPLIKVYISYGLTSLLLNSLLLFIQIDLFGMKKEIAPIINLLITIPLNFLLNKYWAFGKERAKGE